MKNEDKIIELLSEYIAKSDKLEQEIKNEGTDFRKRFDASQKRFEASEKRFEASEKRFEASEKRFEASEKRFEAHEKSIKELYIKNEVILQEIFSISKRVSTLEDK